MKAVKEAIKIMLEPISQVPEEALLEIGPEDFYEPANPDEYLRPDPDIDLEGAEPCYYQQKLLLGLYKPMRSPGAVILFARNLQRFFGALMSGAFKAGYRPKRTDYIKGADLIAYKTYYHELFHYDADVLKTLFGSRHDLMREEALAVAYAYRTLSGYERDYKQSMNPAIFSYLMDHAFRYTSPGYRDWSRFSSNVAFKNGLLEYISPANAPLLDRNGVPVDDLIYSMLERARNGMSLEENVVW